MFPTCIYYCPQRSWDKVMFFTRVCHSVHRGSLSHCILGYTPPRSRTPLGADTTPPTPPPGADPPPEQTPPQEQTPQEETRNPPRKKPGRPPPKSSAYWEIRATSGRYASYWNAFLFWSESRTCFWTIREKRKRLFVSRIDCPKPTCLLLKPDVIW